MVDISQYNFTYEDIVTALIKHLDINDGLWALNLNFKFEAKNFRKDTNNPEVTPGFYGLIQHIGISRVAKGIPGLTVDAAKVNPKLVRAPRTKPN